MVVNMRYIETPDHVRLAYLDWGSGVPLVFLHGWTLGTEIWEYQMQPLAHEGFRCVAYDRRGCGQSDKPATGYDYDTLADDLDAVLDALDLRAVTLVAHSLAGGEVARYASRHALARVSRVAFVATTTPGGLLPIEYVDAQIAALANDRPKYLTEGAPGFFGGGSVSPELVQWGVNLALRASPIATIELFRSMAATDVRVDLKAIDVPTLLVHGSADASAPLEFTALPTAAEIGDSRVEVYEGAGHGLFITHKERFNAELSAFAVG